jgi:hypothetical protein
LHAKKSDNGIDRISAGGDTLYLSNGQTYVPAGSNSGNSGGFTHYIGEQFGGGVIFHVWKDAQGVEHGLIVDLNDLGQEVWSNINNQLIGSSAQSSWDGLSNSNAIIAQAAHTNSAAALCLNSNNGGQSDWYLPSILELNMLWNNYYTVDRILFQISGASQMGNVFWSSKESFNASGAWYFDFDTGTAENNGTTGLEKSTLMNVRAIRAF